MILPTASGGILTGTILAVARAAGETAPLLIVDGLFNPSKTTIDIFGHGVPNMPLLIWEAAEGRRRRPSSRASGGSRWCCWG